MQQCWKTKSRKVITQNLSEVTTKKVSETGNQDSNSRSTGGKNMDSKQETITLTVMAGTGQDSRQDDLTKDRGRRRLFI